MKITELRMHGANLIQEAVDTEQTHRLPTPREEQERRPIGSGNLSASAADVVVEQSRKRHVARKYARRRLDLGLV